MMELDQSAIIDKAEEGATLQEIAKAIGIDKRTLYSYRRSHPDFESALERALLQGAYAWLDELRNELVTNLCDGRDPAIARVRLEAARFYLEKRFPREFSPKQQIDIRAVVDLAPAIERARQRVLNAQVIDVTPQITHDATDQQSIASDGDRQKLAEIMA